MPQLRSNPLFESLSSFIPRKIASGLAVHSRGLQVLENRFPEQFAYGHREILLKYGNIDPTSQIIGTLQHGIFPPGHEIDFRSPSYLWGRKTTFWVFSQLTEIQAKKSGNRHVLAIGAPWSYMRASLSKPLTNLSNRQGKVLVMPTHGQSGGADRSSSRTKTQRAKMLRDAIGNKSATVCLHFADFLNRELRESFEDEGFFVTCVGLGATNPPWLMASGRVYFLTSLMDLMSQHEYYLSDGFGTSLFYAIDMNMQIGIFPEIGKLGSFGTLGGALLTSADAIIERDSIAFLRSEMPNAVDQFAIKNTYSDLADSYLGKESILSPEELRNKLDYKIGVYPGI